MANITFKIHKELTVVAVKTGWDKVLTILSWNGLAPKVDIRPWSPERDKMSKGLSMPVAEWIAFRDALNAIDFTEVADQIDNFTPDV